MWKSNLPASQSFRSLSDNHGLERPLPLRPTRTAFSALFLRDAGLPTALVNRLMAPTDRPVIRCISAQVVPALWRSVTTAERLSRTPGGGRPFLLNNSQVNPCLMSNEINSGDAVDSFPEITESNYHFIPTRVKLHKLFFTHTVVSEENSQPPHEIQLYYRSTQGFTCDQAGTRC